MQRERPIILQTAAFIYKTRKSLGFSGGPFPKIFKKNFKAAISSWTFASGPTITEELSLGENSWLCEDEKIRKKFHIQTKQFH